MRTDLPPGLALALTAITLLLIALIGAVGAGLMGAL